MEKRTNTFKKKERLSAKKTINQLFASGKSFVIFPFRIIYMPILAAENESGVTQLLISVSKKKVKSAVKRNRIKRLIRESYRLNKSILIDSQQKDNAQMWAIAFIYIDTKVHSYPLVQRKIKEALTKIGSLS